MAQSNQHDGQGAGLALRAVDHSSIGQVVEFRVDKQNPMALGNGIGIAFGFVRIGQAELHPGLFADTVFIPWRLVAGQ